MKNKRRGSQLIEILFALVLVGGPLLVAITSVHGGVRASRLNANHVALETLVIDLVDELCTEAVTRLAGVSAAEGDQLVADLVEERAAAMAPESQQRFRSDLLSLVKDLRLTMVPDIGGLPRFFTIEVVARSIHGGTVRAVRNVQLPPPPGPPGGGPPGGPGLKAR